MPLDLIGHAVNILTTGEFIEDINNCILPNSVRAQKNWQNFLRTINRSVREKLPGVGIILVNHQLHTVECDKIWNSTDVFVEVNQGLAGEITTVIPYKKVMFLPNHQESLKTAVEEEYDT